MVNPARRVRRALPTARSTRIGGIVLHLGQAGVLAAAAHQEVDLHVHQAGQQDGVTEVDDVALGCTADADDPVAVDRDDARPDDLAGVDVELDPLL